MRNNLEVILVVGLVGVGLYFLLKKPAPTQATPTTQEKK